MRLSLRLSHSLRFSLIFLFLLLTSNFLLPICGQVWLEITPKAGADQVDTLRPAMDIMVTNWSPYPGLNEYYNEIDETNPDEDATYIYSGGVLNADYGWKHDDFSTSGVIDSVCLVWRARSTATSGTPSIFFGRRQWDGEMWGTCGLGGGSDTAGLTSTYTDYVKTWSVDPCNGNAWTMSSLNNVNRCWWIHNKDVGTASIPDSFGLNSGDTSQSTSGNYAVACKYISSITGTLTALRILFDDTTPTGSIKFSLYSDSSGYPKDSLFTDNTGQAIADGWVSITTSSVAVTANTTYWLTFKFTATNYVRSVKDQSSGDRRYRSHTYTTAWPAKWDNTWTLNTIKAVMKGIGSFTEDQPNLATQSFIVVYSHEGAAPAKRRIGIVQDEDNKGITEGGISR